MEADASWAILKTSTLAGYISELIQVKHLFKPFHIFPITLFDTILVSNFLAKYNLWLQNPYLQ